MTVRRISRWLRVLALALVVLMPALALAGPRSGGSFGGRLGFRSSGGYSSAPRSYSGGGNYYGGGSGSHFIFMPGWGWGGMGYGGMGLFGTLFVLVAVGIGASMLMRAVRAGRRAGGPGGAGSYLGMPDQE
jgi:uncharacterized membrane protein